MKPSTQVPTDETELLLKRTRLILSAVHMIIFCGLVVFLSGCRESSVFEKRYVRIEIPGYTELEYMQLLDSPDPDLRYIAVANLLAADALGSKWGVENSDLSKKIEGLLKDASPKVRAIAAYSFNTIESATSEKDLIKLADDPSDAVRLEAISALGCQYSESPAAVHAILDHLDDQSTLVRLQAIESLGGCRESALRTEVVQQLVPRLLKTNQVEQLKMIKTLGLIGEPQELETVLLEKLHSNEPPVIITTVEAIAQLKMTAAVKMFPELIQRGVCEKKTIIHALRSMDTTEAMQQLTTFLADSDQAVRLAAIEAIGQSAGEQGLKEIVDRFTEEEKRMAEEVDSVKWADLNSYAELMALIEVIKQKIGGVSEDPPIIQFLESPNPHENVIGLFLLAEGRPFDRSVIPVGNEILSPWPHLERLLNNPSPLVRALCLEALGNTVDSRALSILEGAMQDSSFGIRYTAIKALGHYANNTANGEPLRRLYETKTHFIPQTYTTDDKDFLMLQLIETVISNSENQYRSRQRRVNELTSSYSPTRLMAVSALAETKDEAALPVLLDYVEKGTVNEQQAALVLLEQYSQLSMEMMERLVNIKENLQDRSLQEKIEGLIAKLQDH